MNPTDLLSTETALRGLAILTAGCAVVLLMRTASAAARHHVLLCTLVAAIVIPPVAAVLPKWKVVPRWQPDPQAVAPLPEPVYPTAMDEGAAPGGKMSRTIPSSALPAKGSSAVSPVHTASLSWKESAAMAWLGGTAIMLASSLGGMLLLRRLGKRAIRCEAGPLHDAVRTLARRHGLRRKIDVLISREDRMPMVWGVFRHRLLLPASAATWPEHKLRIVLLHELSHLRRHDPASLLVARLALAIHWFNPLAWVAHHQLRTEQESACDDLVLSRGIAAPDYAEEMLDFSANLPSAPALLPATMMLRGGGLERRIRAILDGTLNRRPLSPRGAGNIVLLATLLAAPFAILGAADLIMKPAVRGRILDRNGIVLAETKEEGNVRHYPFKALGVHLIGLSNPNAGGKGTAGIEESYDAELQAGQDVKTTMDARIQSVVENTLRESGIGRGAVVILDPANGDVLASASIPSFDPGTFTDPPHYDKLRDSRIKPFLNRAITAFAPGSTFSIVPSLAACRSGHEDKRHGCGATPFGPHHVSCWLYNKSRDSHGEQNFPEAFANGCGSYFHRLSVDIGIEQMSVTADLLGLGRVSGIRLSGEAPGTFRPKSPEGKPVSDVETCFIAMGQGHASASPLQMASMVATVANGGKVFTPRIDLSVPVSMTADLQDHGITAKRIQELQEAMVEYVEGPVGRRLHSGKVVIAGRSGTAQTVDHGMKSHNAWTIGYAPAEAPRYAIAVMVQHGGSGAGVAGPIARRILEAITDDPPPPAAQEPNEGHMRRVESEDMLHMTP
ncbi:penicillin-binding transpeptidase domain-containing protein [Luteolibacter sp. SL250]|uniref:penicillin-binding transpeptidase domain-containing protein n=1 Tax=Luteolibacter sp. SL250 TaxID=2995170 RepID=UPI0022716F2D|nr:penicillin-binding transpeptidase domain-containing protein [Luteolibacter sp. SL250]WAC20221.1 penicillin-binding transpeptidase domain-containing protein [Luteolibacter sp. SL250]